MTARGTPGQCPTLASLGFRRGQWRGEMHTKGSGLVGDDCLGDVWVRNGEVYVLRVDDGRVLSQLGPFPSSAFERAGGYRVSAAQSVKCWRFKESARAALEAAGAGDDPENPGGCFCPRCGLPLPQDGPCKMSGCEEDSHGA